MKKRDLFVPALLLAAIVCLAEAKGKAPVPAVPPQEGDLPSVLARMNAAALKFKSASADFEWEQFTQLVNEKDLQKGQIYFRRKGKGLEVAIVVASPAEKQIIFKDAKIILYEKGKIDQVTERKVGKDSADIEAGMSLGFGGSGDELQKFYDITLGGWETVDGVKTAKLELVPKSSKFRNTYNKIILWMDPARDVALKQQLLSPSGDYKLVHNLNVMVNEHVPGSVFDLKTSSSTKFIKP
ncbi:MAG TPA: outer membrane lipoprotein carrier protein LolA [Verrucomicrobiae bacterium]|jgi:outer membrane lipoprotein-sorting protein|nr:outer membrane lipoprotein carrier protein LolA [Verrucomicrobiae bacterium]